MRVTNGMLSDTTLRNLNINKERLDRLQSQLTSGQRIVTPSDDPIGTATALEFRTSIAEIEQHLRNAESASSWLDATDSALDTANSALQRARELAVRGANDTLSTEDRSAISNEVSQLIDQMVIIGNSTYGGHYIFGGFKITTAPFSANGNPPTAITYNGDSGKVDRLVDRDCPITVNVPGDEAFDHAFTSLIQLRDDLNAGSATDVSSRIADIDVAINTVLSLRGEVGARMNRLTSQKERLEGLKVNITGLLSQTQDVDMTAAISEFALQQNVYQAALAAGAKAIQPSLLDYLR